MHYLYEGECIMCLRSDFALCVDGWGVLWKSERSEAMLFTAS